MWSFSIVKRQPIWHTLGLILSYIIDVMKHEHTEHVYDVTLLGHRDKQQQLGGDWMGIK